MSSYGKYPKVKNEKGVFVEQRPWPITDFNGDKGLAVQADRDDADINKIIGRFEKSGVLPPSVKGEPFYGDVSGFSGLQDAMIQVKEAERLFMQFPAKIRETFDNDQVKFVRFLEDPKNRDKAIEIGLIQKPVAPAPAAAGGSPPVA